MNTREQWLSDAVALIRPLFSCARYALPIDKWIEEIEVPIVTCSRDAYCRCGILLWKAESEES